jgi:hypothetical protein
MTSLNRRIAIIGAGPSGLAAAEALREKGYKNITVFEKSGRAGGQSLSCTYVTEDQQHLLYDLGSVQPLSSKILRRLFKRYDLHFGRGPLINKSKVIYAYSYLEKEEFANFLKYFIGAPLKHLPAILADMTKLSYYLWRYRRLAKPGFYGFKHWDEATVNVRDWVDARNFKYIGERLVALLVSALTLNNKNKEQQVSIYMVFKALYTMALLPMRYIDGTYRPVREGFQELWLRIAKNFNMVYHANITAISRSATGVVIDTASTSYTFDALIISCTFDKVASLIDMRDAEREVFKNFNFNPGYRAAFIAKRGPVDSVHWYPDTYTTGDAAPYLTFAVPEGKVSDDSYLYSCMFGYCPAGGDAITILQSSAEQMFKDQYGAEITSWVKMQYWPDFGCVYDVDMVKNGVFDKVHAMQGSFNTYYTGQLLCLSGHAVAVDFSYEMVDLFF